jgi:hypothetical protein
VDRSERLIKPGDSWFSPKAIEVVPQVSLGGVEHCIGSGAIPAYQPDANSEYAEVQPGRQTAGANVRRREGNNPDRQLRSPTNRSVGNEVGRLRQPGGWLRSSHP